MSKDLFTQMRESEIATRNFLATKKEVKTAALKFAKELVESGEHNLQEKFAEVVRLKEAVETIESELRQSIPQENFEAFGLKGTYRNGGATPNFSEDEVWADLKNQLTTREELIKIAIKTDTTLYDGEGVEVCKVSLNHRKSSLTITY